MDLAVLAAVKNEATPPLITYDIGCQWGVHMARRWGTVMPEDLRPRFDANDVDVKVPKMHLDGHVALCHSDYNLNYTPGAGRTCGEGIERMWAVTNGLAPSTREMSPGHRADRIDQQLLYHNWKKHAHTGKQSTMRQPPGQADWAPGDTLAQKLLEVLPLAIEHQAELDDFTAALRQKHPDLLEGWKAAYVAWNAGDRSVSPFVPKQKLSTFRSFAYAQRLTYCTELSSVEVQARLQASEDQARLAQKAGAFEDSPSGFIASGLRLESAQ
jgi:hypothetical protein